MFVAFCCFVVSFGCFLTKCQEYIKIRKAHEYKNILRKKILIKNSTLKIKKMFSKKMLRKKMKKVGKKFWLKKKEDQIWVTTLRKMLSKK